MAELLMGAMHVGAAHCTAAADLFVPVPELRDLPKSVSHLS